MRCLLFLLISSSAVFGLSCYQGGSSQDHKARPQLNCNVTSSGSMCVKESTNTDFFGNKLNTVGYFCDDGGNSCKLLGIGANKCSTSKDVTVCCCNSNWCNSSGLFGLTVLALLAPIASHFL